MAKRRSKGEGAINQRHDHPSCPPLLVVGHDEDGKPIKDRADHRCQGRWVARVDLGKVNGKRKSKDVYGPTKADVQVKLRKAMASRDAGTLITKSPTMEQWLNHWLDEICVERGLKINTMKSHRSKTKTYLIPHLGKHRVDALRPEHIRAMYKAMRAQGLQESTLRQTHAILRRALEVAVREGKAARNVAAVIDPPSTKRRKRHGLALADARTVLRLAAWGVPLTDVTGLRWYCALYLGMRQSECLGLRWANVNLDEEWLLIEETLVREPGVGLVFDTPKSESSVRPVPLPTVVLSRFKVAWAQHVAAGGTRDDLVFSRGGQPIDHRADWAHWRDLLAAAGVAHVELHAARNTTATLLEEAGVPDRMIMQILGQSSVEVTHGYQWAELPRLREAMRSLETLVEQADEQPHELPAAPRVPR